jgi:hypothetical protein
LGVRGDCRSNNAPNTPGDERNSVPAQVEEGAVVMMRFGESGF